MWTIEYKHRSKPAERRDATPGVDALKAFRDACEKGEPGRYTLTGPMVLATADVKAHEMEVKWRAGWIFYAMGLVKCAEVARCEAFLKEQDT